MGAKHIPPDKVAVFSFTSIFFSQAIFVRSP